MYISIKPFGFCYTFKNEEQGFIDPHLEFETPIKKHFQNVVLSAGAGFTTF